MPKSGTRRRRARDCWGSDVLLERVPIAWNHYPLVLAKAGTQITNREQVTLDSRLRGNERKRCIDSNGICFSAAKRVPLPHARGDEFFQAHRVALALGLARLDACKAARLHAPLQRRRTLPAPPHRRAPRPAHQVALQLLLLPGGIQYLDAVLVRISERG